MSRSSIAHPIWLYPTAGEMRKLLGRIAWLGVEADNSGQSFELIDILAAGTGEMGVVHYPG